MAALFGGGDAGKSEMRKATRLMEQNIARLEAIGVPTIEAQRIALQSPELVGLLEAESLGPSRFEEISMDPRLQAAQMAALEDITGLAQSKEMDAMSRLNLEQGLAKSIGAQQASFQKIDENLELGAGQKLALKAQEIQDAGQRDMNIAMQAAANAQQAKIAALGQQANLASGIQQQQLGLAEKKANAADVINQFNTQNKQNVNARNLSERQRIAEAGITTKGQQEMYNKGLIQQQFQNQVAKATGISGAQSNLANMYAQQGAASAQGQATQNAAILGGLTGLAGAGIGAYGDIKAAGLKKA
jgi:energy-coupling factor transporter ATP-binding protein EcfA2